MHAILSVFLNIIECPKNSILYLVVKLTAQLANHMELFFHIDFGELHINILFLCILSDTLMKKLKN